MVTANFIFQLVYILKNLIDFFRLMCIPKSNSHNIYLPTTPYPHIQPILPLFTFCLKRPLCLRFCSYILSYNSLFFHKNIVLLIRVAAQSSRGSLLAVPGRGRANGHISSPPHVHKNSGSRFMAREPLYYSLICVFIRCLRQVSPHPLTK